MSIGYFKNIVDGNSRRLARHAKLGAMALGVRLINMTGQPIEIADGLDGRLVLPPGVPTAYPGEIAGADLRRLLREGKVQIEDEPPGLPPIDE